MPRTSIGQPSRQVALTEPSTNNHRCISLHSGIPLHSVSDDATSQRVPIEKGAPNSHNQEMINYT